MAPVRSVRAVGTARVGTRWHSDNRPDFSGIAVWLDAVAEFEIDDSLHDDLPPDGDLPSDEEAADEAAPDEEAAESDPVPWLADAGTPEYEQVWRPLAGSGREPRPGLLVSVVRAGEVTAYPTPFADPPRGAVARAIARLKRPEPQSHRPAILRAEPGPEPRLPRPEPPRKDYGEVRALVGALVEVLVGRRTPAQAANWATPEVRGKLRLPRFSRNAALKSVRLSESGTGVEALALLRDGGRTRAVALRFDRADSPDGAADGRWQCTALQTG